jgi:hypothetical protein
MAAIKTKETPGDVEAFLKAVQPEYRQNDCMTILAMMKSITRQEPKLWSNNVVGFGSYHYKSAVSKQEGDWFITGFSPRKQNLTLYIMTGFTRYDELMKKLGKYKTGGSCLYINKLEDVDHKVLKELITLSYKYMKTKYKK